MTIDRSDSFEVKAAVLDLMGELTAEERLEVWAYFCTACAFPRASCKCAVRRAERNAGFPTWQNAERALRRRLTHAPNVSCSCADCADWRAVRDWNAKAGLRPDNLEQRR